MDKKCPFLTQRSYYVPDVGLETEDAVEKQSKTEPNTGCVFSGNSLSNGMTNL
jgi:hypothetical protein